MDTRTPESRPAISRDPKKSGQQKPGDSHTRKKTESSDYIRAQHHPLIRANAGGHAGHPCSHGQKSSSISVKVPQEDKNPGSFATPHKIPEKAQRNMPTPSTKGADRRVQCGPYSNITGEHIALAGDTITYYAIQVFRKLLQRH